jgi:hypothetical protein
VGRHHARCSGLASLAAELWLGAKMSWFNKWRARTRGEVAKPPEHAVIVHFRYGSTDLGPLCALERQIESAIAAAGAGQYDGNEVNVDGSDAFLYMYGPEGDRLFEVVRPVLESSALMSGAEVRVRYGPPADTTPTREVVLGA